MHIAYLLTGSNLGNREAQMERASAMVSEHCGDILQASAIFETAAWGKLDQPSFLNQALCIRTPLDARALLNGILDIEAAMGRVRGEKYGARIIDIDILFFDKQLIDEPGLHVPHPFLQDRKFALACMHDIAPELVHPVFFKTIQQLLIECNDPLEVWAYEG